MPRKSEVFVSVDLPLTAEQIKAIVGSVPGEGTQSGKVGSVALGLLEQLVEGGMMLPRTTVQRLEEAAGKPVDEATLVDTFEAGMGKQGRRIVFTLPIDPVLLPALEEVARSGGFESPQALMRQDMETLWDQGYFYQAVPQPRRMLMSEGDYAELRGILGGDFDNGTELAAAVKRYVSENAGLFPVGSEA